MMTLAFRALAAGVILLGVSASAKADVLYDNLSQNGSGDSISSYSPQLLAGSFNTSGASSLDLTDVVLDLGGGTTNSTLVVTLQAASSTGGGPTGATLASWTALDSVFGNSNANGAAYDFHLVSPITLASATQYWISVSDSGTTSWFYTSNYVGGTPSGASNPAAIQNQYFIEGSGVNATNLGLAYQMCVVSGTSGTGACTLPPGTSTIAAQIDSSPTPEPGSLAILGMAVVALGAMRRRRRQA